MKAIQTKYLPCTNNRGSRIKAWIEGGSSVTIPYPHELSGEEVHKAAAQKLADKLGWTNKLIGGGLPNGDYCFCLVDVDLLTPLADLVNWLDASGQSATKPGGVGQFAYGPTPYEVVENARHAIKMVQS